MTVAKDPRYARYLKMIQVVSLRQNHLFLLHVTDILTHFFVQGVPVMAIRNKMVMEGLDPNLLEWVLSCPLMFITDHGTWLLTILSADLRTPDAAVPDGGMKSAENQEVVANSSDSESSFSDWSVEV